MSLVSANIRKKITANYTMQRQRNPVKPDPLPCAKGYARDKYASSK